MLEPMPNVNVQIKNVKISGIVLILEYASIFLIVIKIYIKMIANLIIVLYPDQAKTK